MKFNDETIGDMFCDPFYCLNKVDEYYCIEHEAIIDENIWRRTAVRYIEDHGAEDFIDRLLRNLKGKGRHRLTAMNDD